MSQTTVERDTENREHTRRPGRVINRSPALARYRETIQQSRRSSIADWTTSMDAPREQLDAFDGAIGGLHDAVAVGNHSVWGDPLPARLAAVQLTPNPSATSAPSTAGPNRSTPEGGTASDHASYPAPSSPARSAQAAPPAEESAATQSAVSAQNEVSIGPLTVYEGEVPFGPFIHKQTKVKVKFKPKRIGSSAATVRGRSSTTASRSNGTPSGSFAAGAETDVAGATLAGGVGSSGVSFSISEQGPPLAEYVSDQLTIRGPSFSNSIGTENGRLTGNLVLNAFTFESKPFPGATASLSFDVTLIDHELNVLVFEPSLATKYESDSIGGEVGVEVKAKLVPNSTLLLQTAVGESASALFGTVVIPLAVAYAHLRMFLTADDNGRELARRARVEQGQCYQYCASYSRAIRGLPNAGNSSDAQEGYQAGREERERRLGEARSAGTGWGANPAETAAMAELEQLSGQALYTEAFARVRDRYLERLNELAAQCPNPAVARGIAAEAIDTLRAGAYGFRQFAATLPLGEHGSASRPQPSRNQGGQRVQMRRQHDRETDVHSTAAAGLRGTPTSLPYASQIQKAFGRHDVSSVSAHLDGAAKKANTDMGALAYASGNAIAFGQSPDLHTAAHEAAHIVQQRAGLSLAGGVGQTGDTHERHADEVAQRVVSGRSAEDLLDAYTTGQGGDADPTPVQRSVQRRAVPWMPLLQFDGIGDHLRQLRDGLRHPLDTVRGHRHWDRNNRDRQAAQGAMDSEPAETPTWFTDLKGAVTTARDCALSFASGVRSLANDPATATSDALNSEAHHLAVVERVLDHPTIRAGLRAHSVIGNISLIARLAHLHDSARDAQARYMADPTDQNQRAFAVAMTSYINAVGEVADMVPGIGDLAGNAINALKTVDFLALSRRVTSMGSAADPYRRGGSQSAEMGDTPLPD